MGTFQVLCINLFFGPLTFFSLFYLQSWISLCSTSTTSAMFTSCLNLHEDKWVLTHLTFPCFLCRKINQSQALLCRAGCNASDKIGSLLQKVELWFTLHNMLLQLATLKFVAWHVKREGSNRDNNAFQLVKEHCCVMSWAKMLPVLLDLNRTSCCWSWKYLLKWWKRFWGQPKCGLVKFGCHRKFFEPSYLEIRQSSNQLVPKG